MLYVNLTSICTVSLVCMSLSAVAINQTEEQCRQASERTELTENICSFSTIYGYQVDDENRSYIAFVYNNSANFYSLLAHKEWNKWFLPGKVNTEDTSKLFPELPDLFVWERFSMAMMQLLSSDSTSMDEFTILINRANYNLTDSNGVSLMVGFHTKVKSPLTDDTYLQQYPLVHILSDRLGKSTTRVWRGQCPNNVYYECICPYKASSQDTLPETALKQESTKTEQLPAQQEMKQLYQNTCSAVSDETVTFYGSTNTAKVEERQKSNLSDIKPDTTIQPKNQSRPPMQTSAAGQGNRGIPDLKSLEAQGITIDAAWVKKMYSEACKEGEDIIDAVVQKLREKDKVGLIPLLPLDTKAIVKQTFQTVKRTHQRKREMPSTFDTESPAKKSHYSQP